MCCGFEICKGLHVHMNDRCNPVLFLEERKIGNSSLPAKGLKMSLLSQRLKETGKIKRKRRIERGKELNHTGLGGLIQLSWT